MGKTGRPWSRPRGVEEEETVIMCATAQEEEDRSRWRLIFHCGGEQKKLKLEKEKLLFKKLDKTDVNFIKLFVGMD